jgi:TRAP-type uncharacterized transport system fused permease subunit
MGVIVAVLNVSGFTLKITTYLTEAAGSNFILLILLVSLVCIVFGMGVPTVAAYLMVAIMAAPAFVEFGIKPLVSHFFVFYLAILSGLTPPVALNPAVACRISGASFWQTAWHSMKIGSPLVILPVTFLYRPDILAGNTYAILPSFIIALGLAGVSFGVFGVEASFVGYLKRFVQFVLGCIVLFYLIVNTIYFIACAILIVMCSESIWRMRQGVQHDNMRSTTDGVAEVDSI